MILVLLISSLALAVQATPIENTPADQTSEPVLLRLRAGFFDPLVATEPAAVPDSLRQVTYSGEGSEYFVTVIAYDSEGNSVQMAEVSGSTSTAEPDNLLIYVLAICGILLLLVVFLVVIVLIIRSMGKGRSALPS